MEKITKKKQKPRSRMRARSADTKSEVVMIRVSRAEKEELHVRADRAGLSVSAYARRCCLSTDLAAKKLSWAVGLNGELGKITGNLRQVYDHAIEIQSTITAEEIQLRLSRIVELSVDITDNKLAPPLDEGQRFLDPLTTYGRLLNEATRRLNSRPANQTLLDRATEFFSSLDMILEDIRNAGRV